MPRQGPATFAPADRSSVFADAIDVLNDLSSKRHVSCGGRFPAATIEAEGLSRKEQRQTQSRLKSRIKMRPLSLPWQFFLAMFNR
jgi:hypothetical protein